MTVAGTDPLPQLLAEHATLGAPETLVIASQVDAVARWPEIEKHAGEVAVILRRIGSEDPDEWRDMLALLRQLVATSGISVRFSALTHDAANDLASEMAMAVEPVPALPCLYAGTARIRLSLEDGALQLHKGAAGPLLAHRHNLARLRRMAVLEAAAYDQDLSDLASFANGHGPPAPATAPVVVIVVPNGTGLGHVTRMLAVARHLKQDHGARVIFWSFSQAAGILHHHGFETILRQTAKHLGADADHWATWETDEFVAALSQLRPGLVIQDASALQDFVVDALARPHPGGAARLVLVRRGMWQQHLLGTSALASEQIADLVIEPGDLAAEADRGVTRGRFAKTDGFASMAHSAPVTLTRKTEMLAPRAARRVLGLGRGRHCLISLGGDDLWDWSPVLRMIVQAAKKHRIRLVWARSPLAPQVTAGPDMISRSLYPLAPCLTAFDGVISTAGYNSFHELMQLYEGPVLLVPRQHSNLDDQTARADFAAAQGWASVLSEGDQTGITRFMEDMRAGKRVTNRPAWQNGAGEIAETLATLLEPGDR